MANIASNYTPRVYIEYTSDGVPHNATIRALRDVVLDDATALDYVTRWVTFWNAVADELQAADRKADITTTGASYAQQDSNLFLPVTGSAGAVISTLDDTGGAVTPIDKTMLFSIVGRSTGGKRMLLYMWGIRRGSVGVSEIFDDWRIDASENSTAIAQITNKLYPGSTNELGEVLAGADGLPVGFWRARINNRPSARAINRARG